MSSRIRHRRPITVAFATATMTAIALVSTGSVQAQAAPDAESVYIVQMVGAPLATYSGGVAGFSATKPAPGTKLDARSARSTAYKDKLRADYRSALHRAGVAEAKKVYDYGTVLNGFAARLTSTEAAKLRKTAGVARLWENKVVHADTVSTPAFLGIDGPNGVWAKQFGGDAHAGEGVIIGVVDTGFWPESPSFAPLPEPRPDQATINAKWKGSCEVGEDANPANRVACNNKVIGARYFASGGIEAGEFRSPRDRDGHGSHTASTAGGNHGVEATIGGYDLGKISGMAPAARLAIYKALWEKSGGASGNTTDLVAAINQAVEDGVDVINYSISGETNYVISPDEIAFLNAAAAGVFVSAAAGNTAGESKVAHNSPWVTTVAAGTHDRAYGKTVVLGNGASYTGVGVAPDPLPSSPLIDSINAGLSGVPASDAELCVKGSLDPAKVTDKIVLCKRGGNDRVEKSATVKTAGGVGMVLYDPPGGGQVADFHSVPTVHVDNAAGLAIKAYIASNANATASFSAGFHPTVRAPAMADFSSSGPAGSTADLIKPDITAPGVDVIAAFSPPANNGNGFNQISGTSMAAPHIAGIAAMIIQKYPTWSPMMVKSALMTGARPVDNTGGTIQRLGVDQTPLDFGSGQVRPASGFDPGLVYDSTWVEWYQFACGIGQLQQLGGGEDACAEVGSIDPSNLNYPSISVGDLTGKQTITRTVTNVTGRAGVYDAKIEAPAGFSVTVSPSRLVIPPRRSATFQVTITRTNAAFVQWRFGALSWKDNLGHEVRSPIGVRAVQVASPAEITGTGATSAKQYQVTPGYNGTLTASAVGLTEASVATMHLTGANTAFDKAHPSTGDAVGVVDVTVPAGTKVARFATYAADYGANADLDLYIYEVGADGTLKQVGESAGGTAEESFTFTDPGAYRIYAVQFQPADGQTEQDVKHYAFVVPDTPGGLSVTPGSQQVISTTAVNLTASWSGLTAGRRYLGVIQYGDGAHPHIGRSGFTYVSVTS